MNKVRESKNRRTQTHQSSTTWVKRSLSAIATIAIFCVTSVAAQASELTDGLTVEPATSYAWSWGATFWILWMPACALMVYSLIVNKRKGWGWIALGTGIVLILIVLQFAWSIITAFRGDPGDDEDYFKPLDNWTSDSF